MTWEWEWRGSSLVLILDAPWPLAARLALVGVPGEVSGQKSLDCGQEEGVPGLGSEQNDGGEALLGLCLPVNTLPNGAPGCPGNSPWRHRDVCSQTVGLGVAVSPPGVSPQSSL